MKHYPDKMLRVTRMQQQENKDLSQFLIYKGKGTFDQFWDLCDAFNFPMDRLLQESI